MFTICPLSCRRRIIFYSVMINLTASPVDQTVQWRKRWQLYQYSIQIFVWRDWGKPRRTSTRVVGVLAELRTVQLPNKVANVTARANVLGPEVLICTFFQVSIVCCVCCFFFLLFWRSCCFICVEMCPQGGLRKLLVSRIGGKYRQ
jgi:hypothetical protein